MANCSRGSSEDPEPVSAIQKLGGPEKSLRGGPTFQNCSFLGVGHSPLGSRKDVGKLRGQSCWRELYMVGHC